MNPEVYLPLPCSNEDEYVLLANARLKRRRWVQTMSENSRVSSFGSSPPKWIHSTFPLLWKSSLVTIRGTEFCNRDCQGPLLHCLFPNLHSRNPPSSVQTPHLFHFVYFTSLNWNLRLKNLTMPILGK